MTFELGFAIFAAVVSCASLGYSIACDRKVRRLLR